MIQRAKTRLPFHLFQYDASSPLDPLEQPMGVNEGLRWTHVVFKGGEGRFVPGVYVVAEDEIGSPPQTGRRTSGVLVQHGAGTSKYARFVTACIDILGHAGFACLALDAVGHGEREDARAHEDEVAARRLRASPGFVPANVVDFRRGLDFLASRPEVDPARLAYIGSSMGAMLGAILCAVDPRPQAVVLRCGGARTGPPAWAAETLDPEEAAALRERADALDHLRYIGAIAPRALLLLNNTEDEVFSQEAVLRLFEAAGEPKELRWFPGGHRDNHELHAAECLEWLERWLRGE